MERIPDNVVFELFDEDGKLLLYHVISAFSVVSPRKGRVHWYNRQRGPYKVVFQPPVDTIVARATLSPESIKFVFGKWIGATMADPRNMLIKAEDCLSIVFGKKDLRGRKTALLSMG